MPRLKGVVDNISPGSGRRAEPKSLICATATLNEQTVLIPLAETSGGGEIAATAQRSCKDDDRARVKIQFSKRIFAEFTVLKIHNDAESVRYG